MSSILGNHGGARAGAGRPALPHELFKIPLDQVENVKALLKNGTLQDQKQYLTRLFSMHPKAHVRGVTKKEFIDYCIHVQLLSISSKPDDFKTAITYLNSIALEVNMDISLYFENDHIHVEKNGIAEDFKNLGSIIQRNISGHGLKLLEMGGALEYEHLSPIEKQRLTGQLLMAEQALLQVSRIADQFNSDMKAFYFKRSLDKRASSVDFDRPTKAEELAVQR